MTLFEEMIAAGRGVLALLIGRRNAGDYFDLTLRGLAGSFVAFIVATTVNAYLPGIMGLPGGGLHAWQALLMAAVLYTLQIGFSALVLRQIKRLDGLVPYLVADNWASFFITIITILLALSGLNGDVALVVIAILVIVVEINVARLIVTLTPLQIVMFLLAQMIGVLIGLMLVGMVVQFPEAAATSAGAM